MDNYAIPGFQTPTSPNFEGRVETGRDGVVNFSFLDNVPLLQPMPKIDVYIGIERGRELNLQAWTETGRYIYVRPDLIQNVKSYWLRLYPSDLTILPGTYKFRFVVEGQEIAQKSVTIPDYPANPVARRLDFERNHPEVGETIG